MLSYQDIFSMGNHRNDSEAKLVKGYSRFFLGIWFEVGNTNLHLVLWDVVSKPGGTKFEVKST